MDLGMLLRRQGGVVRLDQAVAGGVSARTVRRRVADGEWRRLHPGVYLVSGHRLTNEARVRAAWLWAGDKALVSGPAAAYRHGMLDRAPDVVEVTVPRRHNPRARPDVSVRRRDIAATDQVGLRDVRLTERALT
jgi:predicted transcriptional regulator of viral defense system